MSSHENIRKKREELTHKTFVMALQILAIFGVPAFIGYHIGNLLNEKTGIAPHGHTLALGVAFVCSWAIVIRMYRKVSAAFRALDEEEAALMDEKRESK